MFVAITKNSVYYKIKRDGQTWGGQYFRRIIIHELDDWINGRMGVVAVDDIDKFMIIHDGAPGWTAKDTQRLLAQHFGIDHFVPSRNNKDSNIPPWAGNSPDLNVVENFGSILMEDVALKIWEYNQQFVSVNKSMLVDIIEDVIDGLASNGDIFSNFDVPVDKKVIMKK